MTQALRDATQALSPCPFCGGRPSLDDCRTIWAVRCECGVCMLGERAPEPDGSEPAGYWDRIRQTAIDAWNRRAALSTPQPAAEERVAELMRLVDDAVTAAKSLAHSHTKANSHYWLNCSAEAVEQLARALLSALQEDAEHAAMYRWLRDGNYDLEGLTSLSGAELDAAIRSAMTEKKA